MFEFTSENLAEFQKILQRYSIKRAALLPALWLVQKQTGFISREAMLYVAGLLDVAPAKVYEVVTFYTMFHQKPVGEYHIQVCRTLSCQLLGSPSITEHLKKRLGIGLGEITTDGRFSLVEVECLGSCGTGPMFQVNDEYHENLTIEKVDKILEELK
ncbi:MAG: NADH-quinone oxidoreductase subunit NuoE [Deltaproteobacteria bacterium]|nr:NADH-quinone oxidoreductase subunit NuoE [Deltaproteobacteria bacterium]